MTELRDSSEVKLDPNELNLQARLKVASEWVFAARDIVQECDVEAATEAWNYLNEKTAIGIPMPGKSLSTAFIEKPTHPTEEYSYITPILSQDLGRLDEDDWRKPYVGGEGASPALFRESTKAVYFGENTPLSTRAKGILMLHEAMHALNESDHRIDSKAEGSHWMEEANVYEMEFDILSVLGKDRYIELVNRLANSIQADKSSLDMTYNFTDEDYAVIKDIFGQDISQKEIGLWRFVITENAWYEYFKSHVENPKYQLAIRLQKAQPKS